jgi:hypothetical protein
MYRLAKSLPSTEIAGLIRDEVGSYESNDGIREPDGLSPTGLVAGMAFTWSARSLAGKDGTPVAVPLRH